MRWLHTPYQRPAQLQNTVLLEPGTGHLLEACSRVGEHRASGSTDHRFGRGRKPAAGPDQPLNNLAVWDPGSVRNFV